MGKEYLDITAEDFVLAKTDDEVFNKIYKANEKLVNFCFNRCCHLKVPKEELYNTLVDGLIKAINCYDPNRSMSFAAFAVPCMMNNARQLRRRCSSSKDVLRRIEQYDSMEKVVLYSKDGEDKTVEDVVSDQSYENYYENELKETINTNRLLSFLCDRDLAIFKMYFSGIIQAEVAKAFGLSQGYLSKVLVKNKLFLKNLANTAMDVHSYVFNKCDMKMVAKLTDLSNVTEVEYFEAVYQYLYNNVDNIEEIQELGLKLGKAVPSLPEDDKLNSDKPCEMI